MQSYREPRTESLYQTNHIQLHHATVWCLLMWKTDKNDNSEDRWRARMVSAAFRAMKKHLERGFCGWWVRLLCMRKPHRQQQTKTLNIKESQAQKRFHGSFLTSDLQSEFSWEFRVYCYWLFSAEYHLNGHTCKGEALKDHVERFTLNDRFMTRLLLCVG